MQDAQITQRIWGGFDHPLNTHKQLTETGENMRKALFVILTAILTCAMLLPTQGQAAPGNEVSSRSLEEEAAGPQGFVISLKISNPNSGQPQTTFYFGDEVGYEITASIPPSAEGKKATVNLSATVKIGGVTIPYATSHIFSGPVTNPSYETANTYTMYEPHTWNGKFKVPQDIPVPELSATVKVDISIQDIGTSRVNQRITLRTKKQLPKPVLSFPAEGANMLSNTSSCSTSTYRMWFTFQWNQVPWATKYQISITNIEHNQTSIFDIDHDHPYFNPNNYGGCLNNDYQTWKWKVRAGNHYTWSDWSDERHFTITRPSPPTLLSPNDSAVLDNGCNNSSEQMQWSFDWTDVAGATQYNLYVYRTGSPSPFINVYPTTSQHLYSSYSYVSDLTNWKWKVRSAVGSFWSDWSPERSFSVEPVNTDCQSPPGAPGKVTLVSPWGTINTNVPTYIWHADSSATYYNLVVNDTTGTKINSWYSAVQALCPSGTGNCSVTPSVALSSGSAAWWIDAYNGSGYGPWSDSMAFVVP
jgi:hypothetical protein